MNISKTFVTFSQAFATSSESILDFFGQAGLGFYIPLYQREYSWDTENVEQLMDDLCQGAESLLDEDSSILFMGTVILLTDSNPTHNINPRDQRALPTRVDRVIDGQQRISTFALLATLLHWQLKDAKKRLETAVNKNPVDDGANQEIQQVYQDITSQLSTISELYSVDIRRGTPTIKPIIIRGNVDCWTLDGADQDNYKSDVSLHVAEYIRSSDTIKTFPFKGNSLVKRNLRRMQESLNNVLKAHDKQEDFPPAWDILEKLPAEAVWSYPKPALDNLIKQRHTPLQPVEEALCVVVQLLTFISFLLKRCCFTVIKPTAESWAFDMFQSLNATGTPLTALETFKPMVSNYVDTQNLYKGSKSEKSFALIDKFLDRTRTANEKNRLTNEYLTTLALIQDGSKISTQFSVQRKYLEEQYTKSNVAADREEFVCRMSELAVYRKDVSDVVAVPSTRVPLTDSASPNDAEEATLCVAYLKKANHKMADAILGRFYSDLLRADDVTRSHHAEEFVSVCKALAAFYTIWRAASSNSGLDDAYRKLLRGTDSFSWTSTFSNQTSLELKSRLRDALTNKQIGDKQSWLQRAQTELRFKNGVDQVCKFALLAVAHNTIPDPGQPGLMTPGQAGISPYLRLEKWLSDDLSTIEHIAPQNPAARTPWDSALYVNEEYQRLGNLTLLPLEINISAGNKGWQEKCLYYKYLTVKNPAIDRPDLQQQAHQQNIVLQPQTIQRLEQSCYHAHIQPIAAVGMNGNWDLSLVKARSERMCSILWESHLLLDDLRKQSQQTSVCAVDNSRML